MLFVFLLCFAIPITSLGKSSTPLPTTPQNCECNNPLEVGYPPYSGYRCSKDCFSNYFQRRSSSVTRYYFDMYSGYCKEFTYYGCGGNSNNFRTLYECQKRCEHHGNGYEEYEYKPKYCYVCPNYGVVDRITKRSIGDSPSYYCKGGGCHKDSCKCAQGYICCKVSCYGPRRRRASGSSYGYGYECVPAHKQPCTQTTTLDTTTQTTTLDTTTQTTTLDTTTQTTTLDTSTR